MPAGSAPPQPASKKRAKKPAAVAKASAKSATAAPKTAKKTAPKAVKKEAPVATAAAPEAAVKVPEIPPAVSEEVVRMMAEQEERIKRVGALYSELRSAQRDIDRVVGRDLRALHRIAYRRQKRAGNRQPSGFVKPTGISQELAAFLGKPAGEKMARTAVTREINAYIREHQLQDKDNGRKINADAPLTRLLKVPKNEELTYFNLQKYMSPHFQKAESSA